MQALVFTQCAINTIVALLAKRNFRSSLVDNVPSHLYSLCGVSYFMAMLFSNLALEWVSYPTQVILIF